MLDYELLDFGHGRKLERFGAVVLDRPEVLAAGVPRLSANEWSSMAHGYFKEDKNAKGQWINASRIPEQWSCAHHGSTPWQVLCKTGPYKHIGLFPEQQAHWNFLQKALKEGDKYLNLFAYTGAASLAAASAGADVYHVEASRSVVNWAVQNAKASDEDSIHWVCDDALKFAEREIKRGRKYAGISMDPPVYGRAKGGARWRLEDKLEQLMWSAARLLQPNGFAVLNTYSPQLSIDDMLHTAKKCGLEHNENGWLSVDSSDGRKLELSKFMIARFTKPQHFR